MLKQIKPNESEKDEEIANLKNDYGMLEQENDALLILNEYIDIKYR
jgi:hypothetical protein